MLIMKNILFIPTRKIAHITFVCTYERRLFKEHVKGDLENFRMKKNCDRSGLFPKVCRPKWMKTAGRSQKRIVMDMQHTIILMNSFASVTNIKLNSS